MLFMEAAYTPLASSLTKVSPQMNSLECCWNKVKTVERERDAKRTITRGRCGGQKIYCVHYAHTLPPNVVQRAHVRPWGAAGKRDRQRAIPLARIDSDNAAHSILPFVAAGSLIHSQS